MGAKPVVTSFTSGVINPAQLNSNLDILAGAIADSLDRAGDSDTNNQMSGDLDMGGFDIVNVGDVGGFLTNVQAAVDEAEGYASTATTQADLATTQAGLASASAVTAAQQADLATSNGAAQVLLAEAQVALAEAQVVLASGFASDAEDQADIATAQAVIATTQAELATATTAAGGSVLATPNAVAVRDGDGKLAGDILGNATTATKHGVLNVKVLDIGDWDMDASPSVSVSVPGIDLSKVRGLSIAIRHDSGGINDLMGDLGGTAIVAPAVTMASNSVTMNRKTGGVFDSTSYDSTSYNRGWITIWYID